MIRAIAIGAAIALLPLAASAQSTFERFENVAESMNAMMNDAFVAEIPALEGNLPDPEWDEPMRTAYTCMYDGYVERVGEEPVADMVTDMEEMLETIDPAVLIEGGAAVENPEGISDDEALQIVTECGLMDVFMARMAESGAMQILMQQQ
ncbi:hypothetical protein [Gymnodinialimonas hymeniacidonis]|uniref:hypothetical protein n=1 Tax=Gymnodinialimonas hymeniacidonis TaxID=3126508 RepID=UPI0034C60916